MSEIKHKFTMKIRKKGWEAKDVAKYWGITPRHIARVAIKPSKRYLRALDYLPKLPDVIGNDEVDTTPKLIKEAIENGWDLHSLAKHWGIKKKEVIPKGSCPTNGDLYDFSQLGDRNE